MSLIEWICVASSASYAVFPHFFRTIFKSNQKSVTERWTSKLNRCIFFSLSRHIFNNFVSEFIAFFNFDEANSFSES